MALTLSILRAPRTALLTALALVGCYTGLALLDVVPGGWRLRTFFVSQGAQDLRRRTDHREARLAQFRTEPVPPPGGTLFIGSSTIERFPLGDLLPEFEPIQRGIGDEDLNGLEARFQRTLERVRPSRVVLYAGSINVRRAVDDGSWTPPGEIVRRIAGLQRAAEGCSVWILGILPERSTGPELARRLRETNRGLEEFAEETPGVLFLNLATPPLVSPGGSTGEPTLVAAYAADELHLNESGYEIVAQWLKSSLSGTSGPYRYDSGDAAGGQGASLPK